VIFPDVIHHTGHLLRISIIQINVPTLVSTEKGPQIRRHCHKYSANPFSHVS